MKRAVVRIDPAAADKRRERAEKKRRARACTRTGAVRLLWAPEDIPAAQGAAAKARVNAIARAARSAVAAEELPALEARTALGLILGTHRRIARHRPAWPGLRVAAATERSTL